MTRIRALVAEAVALVNAGADACDLIGHAWEPEGGRPCPRGNLEASQTVYRCARCDQWDYGEPGGPGHADCSAGCELACRFYPSP